MVLGQAYAQQGDYDAAVQVAASTRSRGRPTWPRPTPPWAHLPEAGQAARGRARAARGAGEPSRRLRVRGITWRRCSSSGRPDEALPLLRAVLKARPDYGGRALPARQDPARARRRPRRRPSTWRRRRACRPGDANVALPARAGLPEARARRRGAAAVRGVPAAQGQAPGDDAVRRRCSCPPAAARPLAAPPAGRSQPPPPAGRRGARGEAVDEAGPPYAAAGDRGSVQRLLELARVQTQRREPRRALADARGARALAPNSEEVLSAFARVALRPRRRCPRSSRWSRSRACARRSEYHYLLGVAPPAGGRPDGRRGRAAGRAQRLEPDRPRTLVALGLALNSASATPRRSRCSTAPRAGARRRRGARRPGRGGGRAAASSPRPRTTRGARSAPAGPARNRQPGARPGAHEAGALRGGARPTGEGCPRDPTSPKAYYQLSLAVRALGDEARSARHRAVYQQKLSRRPRRGGARCAPADRQLG